MIEAKTSHRVHTRLELGLSTEPLMLYVGKFGGWYMTTEMVDFFAVARKSIPGLHFLVLTQSENDEIEQAFARREIRSGYTVSRAAPRQLGNYLAAADFGLCFVRPAPSKVSSSPTKVGEYLAAGLPVICTSGIGDLDRLITPDVGVLLQEHQENAYRVACERMIALLDDPRTCEHCRAVARSELSLADVGVPRYRELYGLISRVRSSGAGEGWPVLAGRNGSP
jgi:hypothetical protein